MPRLATRFPWPTLVLWSAVASAQLPDARPWSRDQAILPFVEFRGERVTIHNIRNCEYRTADDYTVRHYDRTLNVNSVRTVDFIVVPFAETPSLAHTMLSFGLSDDTYIAVSIEIRKRQGDSYSPAKTMLPLYQLMYVIGDERDLIRLRTNHRHDGVYLYRTKATPIQAQNLFLSVMRRADKLSRDSEIYNTITNNCTTNIRRHINEIAPNKIPYDYRVLMPGYSDRLAYDLGLIETAGSFEATRERARINFLANLHRNADDFSQRIRAGTLPATSTGLTAPVVPVSSRRRSGLDR